MRKTLWRNIDILDPFLHFHGVLYSLYTCIPPPSNICAEEVEKEVKRNQLYKSKRL